jgi:hypothetical protein
VRVALADNDGLPGLYARLWMLWLTVLTILITAWFCTLGPLPAVIALVIAKHVLVAILVMGLGVDARDQAGGEPGAIPPRWMGVNPSDRFPEA